MKGDTKMSKWMLQYKSADFNQISETFSIDPILARIIRNRGFNKEKEISSFLFARKEDMYSPFLLKDMQLCVDIIKEKLTKHAKIRVIGDYDIDGVCASYILCKGIRQIGGNVDVCIPERIKDGYGLNERLILEAEKDEIDLIITCDNGISAVKSIALAKEKNIAVIITDHHEIPYTTSSKGVRYILPEADAIVNPKQKNCSYPYKGICGALIAYKVMDALSMSYGMLQKELDELLGFAAFATVGDVMELVDENRIVVKEGLKILEKTNNVGLQELKKVCDLHEKKLSPYHIGFILGPCINATGRLDTAKRALNLFLSSKKEEANKFAMELKIMNEERKLMTAKGVEQAITYIEENNLEEDQVLVIYLEDCHESIAGIIAGRIREKYWKPTFVLTKTEYGIKGSGRSIEAYNMYDKMNACKELLDKFGGHKAAAGLSMKIENLEAFRNQLNHDCMLREEDLQETVTIDMELPLSYFTIARVKQFSILEPFGMGNKKPLFAKKNMRLIIGKIIGEKGNVHKLIVEEETGKRMELICFKGSDWMKKRMEDCFPKGMYEKIFLGEKIEKKEYMHILYYPMINEYRGRETLQFVLEDFKSVFEQKNRKA